MEFLGMGWGEILLILIIALIIFGPGKIVEVSRSMGKLARSLKKATSDLTSEITREIDDEKRVKQPPLAAEQKPPQTPPGVTAHSEVSGPNERR
jgi:sec-independent protein translocase protein TatA